MQSEYALIQHTNGMWTRVGVPSDDYVINERQSYEAMVVCSSDTVLDLGGNIGMMARRFLEDGAKHVVTVEPFPDNAAMIVKNLEPFDDERWTLVQAAAVGDNITDPTIALRMPDTNFGMCSLVEHDVEYARLTHIIDVPTVQLRDLLDKYHPDVIKIDIEAGEYGLLNEITSLPPYVRELAIEWHQFAPHLEDNKFLDAYNATHAHLSRAQGFAVVSTIGEFIPQLHSAILHVYRRESAVP